MNLINYVRGLLDELDGAVRTEAKAVANRVRAEIKRIAPDVKAELPRAAAAAGAEVRTLSDLHAVEHPVAAELRAVDERLDQALADAKPAPAKPAAGFTPPATPAPAEQPGPPAA
ncbi:hypothetical protein ACFC1T_02190 [Kitasatospora sp. NPDC056076]|uniref:hypothetical protein n=1 Tax=Kitasatospora sp. NPDC056076 TaxID=3345703 RepID=UPI0035D62D6E